MYHSCIKYIYIHICNIWYLICCVALFLLHFVISLNCFLLQTGFLVSLPYLIKAIVGPSGGILADMLIMRKFSVRNVRRMIFTFGEFLSRALYFILIFLHVVLVLSFAGNEFITLFIKWSVDT